MPLDSNHIAFLKSERLTDQVDGGGQITSLVLPDNVSNNLFPGVSNLDAVNGRLSARKLFLSVVSPNTLWYYGAGVYLRKPPANPAISALLAKAVAFGEEREALAERIESYLVKGPLTPMALYGTGVVGQRAISTYQMLNDGIPKVGAAFVLVQNTSGYPFAEQYVRVVDVVTRVQTAVDPEFVGMGEFERRIVTLYLAEPLQFEFTGMQLIKRASTLAPTKIYQTTVADAARYYGILPLVAAANSGQPLVQVSRVMEQLVPSTQTEKPVLDVPIQGGVSVSVSGGARTAQVRMIAHTIAIPIEPINRNLNYVKLLLPKPTPGSVVVSYRIMGEWYDLKDQGDGTLLGDGTDPASTGAGSIVYATGSLSVTLPALPDIASSILFSWGSPVHFDQPALALTAVQFNGWKGKLSNEGIEPGTVTITWTANGLPKKAKSGEDGQFVGDAKGNIRHSTGEFSLIPTALPDPHSTPVVTYEFGATVVETFTPTKDGSGFVTITTAQPIKPKTLVVQWETVREKTLTEMTKTEEAG